MIFRSVSSWAIKESRFQLHLLPCFIAGDSGGLYRQEMKEVDRKWVISWMDLIQVGTDGHLGLVQYKNFKTLYGIVICIKKIRQLWDCFFFIFQWDHWVSLPNQTLFIMFLIIKKISICTLARYIFISYELYNFYQLIVHLQLYRWNLQKYW